MFNFDYKSVALDEIALEGLDGILLELLWKRIEKRTSLKLTEKWRKRIWDAVVKCDQLTLYNLPKPRECIDIVDRFSVVDPKSGHIMCSETPFDGPYHYDPVNDDTSQGSCQFFKERKKIPKQRELSLEDAINKYGNHLIIVASFEERCKALMPHMSFSTVEQLTPLQYCLLELIGKSRENGQNTTGPSNILKVSADPKQVFYYKKMLMEMGIISKADILHYLHSNSQKCAKTQLLTLKRFYQPAFECVPKSGLVGRVIKHLKQQPGCRDSSHVMRSKKIVEQTEFIRFKKSTNMFKWEEITTEPPQTSKSKSRLKDRFLCYNIYAYDEPDLEEEEHNTLKCNYHVGIPLNRQAYERFIQAGKDGLSLNELNNLLGIGHLASRAICKRFVKLKLVRPTVIYRKKARLLKFVAVNLGVDHKLIEEQNKLKQFLTQNTTSPTPKETTDNKRKRENDKDNEIVPIKVPRIEDKSADDVSKKITDKSLNFDIETINQHIKEVKVLVRSSHDSKRTLKFIKSKPMSMRQLKIFNSILKLTREKLAIPGYQILCDMISEDTNEKNIITSSVKLYLQSLINDGQVKLYYVKMPNKGNNAMLICSPEIDKDHPIIVSKYMEFYQRGKTVSPSLSAPEAKSATNDCVKLYHRYIKAQMLHEYIYRYAYDEERLKVNKENLPPGFVNFLHVIPDMTVKDAISNYSYSSWNNIAGIKYTEQLFKMKLKDAPTHICQKIMQSPQLRCSLRDTLTILASFGLVQFCNPTVASTNLSYLFKYIYYINRKASIINTQGDWPGNSTPETLTYEFNIISDIKKYWEDVRNVAFNTNVLKHTSTKISPTIPVRSMSDVENHDNGTLYGDGGGACGFDSQYYLELVRFWNITSVNLSQLKISQKPIVRKTIIKQKRTVKIKKKKPIIPKDNNVTKADLQSQRNHQMSLKAAFINWKNESKVKAANPNIKTRTRTPKVIWTEQTDHILFLSDCASSLMKMTKESVCGISLRFLNAKDIINDEKITCNLCSMRMKTMILSHYANNRDFSYPKKKENLMNAFKKHEDLMLKYNNILKKAKKDFSINTPDYVLACRMVTLEIIYILHDLYLAMNKENKEMTYISNSLKEFNEKYEVSSPYTKKLIYYGNSNATNTPTPISIVQEIIFMTITATKNSLVRPKQAEIMLSFLNAYDDATLKTALNDLRNKQIVSLKDKAAQNYIFKQNPVEFKAGENPLVASSCYKWSSNYSLRMKPKFNLDFYYNVTLDNQIGVTTLGSQSINCIIFELLETCIDIEPEPFFVDQDIHMNSSIPESCMVVHVRKKNEELLLAMKDPDITDNAVEYLQQEIIIPIENMAGPSENNFILDFLMTKDKEGASYIELKNFTKMENQTLIDALTQLENQHSIKRVGIYENRIVHRDFIRYWTVTTESCHALPKPWLFITDIDISLFIDFCLVVMDEVFLSPGINLPRLKDKCVVLSTRNIHDVCFFLHKTKCAKLKTVHVKEIDLFSDENGSEVMDYYNPYADFDSLLVFPARDMMVRFANTLKMLLEHLKRS